MQRRPVLDDVAQLAGTSSSTVSRVISGRGMVSKDTAERVKKALAATGFVLNHRRSAAARMRRPSSGLRYNAIGVLMFEHPRPDTGLTRINVRESILHAVLCAADAVGMKVHMYRVADSDWDRQTVPPSLLSAQVDGLLSQAATGRNFTMLEEVAPVVFFGNHPTRACPIPSVEAETTVAMDAIVKHLHALGHRRYVFVSQSTVSGFAHQSLAQRERAFEESIREHDCVSETVSVSASTMETFLAQFIAMPLHERPTALVCGNDGLANNAIFQLMSHGVRVPDDVSITGFDGISSGDFVSGKLTTWLPDWEQVGKRSFEILLARARGESVPLRTLVGGELIVRDSTGVAHGAGNEGATVMGSKS